MWRSNWNWSKWRIAERQQQKKACLKTIFISNTLCLLIILLLESAFKSFELSFCADFTQIVWIKAVNFTFSDNTSNVSHVFFKHCIVFLRAIDKLELWTNWKKSALNYFIDSMTSAAINATDNILQKDWRPRKPYLSELWVFRLCYLVYLPDFSCFGLIIVYQFCSIFSTAIPILSILSAPNSMKSGWNDETPNSGFI